MSWMTKARTAALAVGGAVSLSACGYGGYGNVGLGVGYADAGYYDPYYDGYGYGGYGYDGFGYGYGYPGYGWYNGFYYPGTGYYVFDRGGRRYRWSDSQRNYWQNRGNYPGGPRDRGAWTRGQVTPPANGQAGQPGRWNGRPRGGWQQGQVNGGAVAQGQAVPARPQAQAPAFRSAPQTFRAPSGGGGGGGHGTWTQQGGGRRR